MEMSTLSNYRRHAMTPDDLAQEADMDRKDQAMTSTEDKLREAYNETHTQLIAALDEIAKLKVKISVLQQKLKQLRNNG